MYPFIRIAKEMWKFRNAAPLPLLGTHRSTHLCWPWDLDMWNELNNGRTLTLYDLGRLPLARRTGLDKVLRIHGWGITVAGNTTPTAAVFRPLTGWIWSRAASAGTRDLFTWNNRCVRAMIAPVRLSFGRQLLVNPASCRPKT